MLLLRGGVPRRNSFPTVVGEQPSSLAMALFESPCRLRYWIAPLSSRPRCCPFLRSAATVIYCVQSIVIALLLVNVVWELHSTIRVKSLWIFFSQVSNFIMQSTKRKTSHKKNYQPRGSGGRNTQKAWETNRTTLPEPPERRSSPWYHCGCVCYSRKCQ